MSNRLVLIAVFTAASGAAQIPPAPNTNPKPVNDPTNTNNITTDSTIPTGGGGSTIPVGNPGIGSNPGSGMSDQMREAADQIFANNVALQSLTELELGKLAAANASSDAVKAYSMQMTESNGKMNERLKRIATRGHVSLPNAIDAKNQSRIDKLAKLTGVDFDRAFAKDQVQSNERSLRSFEQEIQNGSDAPLRNLATRATPAIQKQLQDAKDLEKSLKGK